MIVSSLNSEKMTFFQDQILMWYQENGRKFEWRRNGLSSYEKILTEILLQRTKAETVAKFFKAFFKQYPTWKSINTTTIEEMQESLKPFGLWRQRAVLLKKLSYEMIRLHCRIPKDREAIDALPGIGQYVGNTIEVLIHKTSKPFLDVNMARVLERFFGKRKLADIRYDPYLQELAHKVVNHSKCKEINWAILDFGALVCKARKPECGLCVLLKKCKLKNSL